MIFNNILWNPYRQMEKRMLTIITKKGALGRTTNWVITLTSVTIKIFDFLPLNSHRTHIVPVLRRSQNGFCQNKSISGQILSIRQILIIKSSKAKHIPVVFFKAFEYIDWQKMQEILLTLQIPVETGNFIMMLYTNTNSLARPFNGDTYSFGILKKIQ